MSRSALRWLVWTVVTVAGGCAREPARQPTSVPEPEPVSAELDPSDPARTRALGQATPTEVIEFGEDEAIDGPTERIVAQPEREPMPSMLQGLRMAPS